MRRMVPMARIERATSPLPRECSTTELHGPGNPSPDPRLAAPAGAGAGEGNRTLVVSLEGFCSTIELHPRASNLSAATRSAPPAFSCGHLVEGEGFEPSKAEPADLQSAPFDRSGTPPEFLAKPSIICSRSGSVKPDSGLGAHLRARLGPGCSIVRRAIAIAGRRCTNGADRPCRGRDGRLRTRRGRPDYSHKHGPGPSCMRHHLNPGRQPNNLSRDVARPHRRRQSVRTRPP